MAPGREKGRCGMLDDVRRLLLLVVPKEFGGAVFGDDRGLLKAGDWFINQSNDGRHIRFGVPRTQPHERLAARAVHRSHDEVGLPTEAGVDARVDARGIGLAK